MPKNGDTAPRVLAFFPAAKGLGYAAFEGPSTPIDWGVRTIDRKRKGHVRTMARELIEWNAPEIVAIENVVGEGSRRGPWGRQVTAEIADVAESDVENVRSYSRGQIRQCFMGYSARTKDEIARVIAREIPELEHRVPPVRLAWNSEDRRMPLFDAAALALTHYFIESARAGD